jgi:hypothetical protein
MYSPLMFLFDDPANDGWVKPSGTMVQPDGSGNGFGWGQASHVLAWVLHVGGLSVDEVRFARGVTSPPSDRTCRVSLAW